MTTQHPPQPDDQNRYPAPETPPAYTSASYPQQAYQNQPYPGQPYPTNPYGYSPAPPTNTMAILSLIFAFVFSVLGIVFGHIALSQIKNTGEGGRGLAIAGLIISYVSVGLFVLWIGFVFLMIASAPSYSSY